MKRRDLFATAASLAGATVALWPQAALAQAKLPEAGTDFVKLETPAPVDTPAGKIEVVEFFWYSCPHCNAFEPLLAPWAKKLPKDVVFTRIPVAFREDFVPQQKLFYALQAMGLVDQLHSRVFAAIHKERLNLTQAPAITDWVVKQGVDRAAFTRNFNSFSNATEVTRATQLTAAYQIEGVPALGVAGRFFTDGAMAKSMERALQVTEFLVAQVRAGH